MNQTLAVGCEPRLIDLPDGGWLACAWYAAARPTGLPVLLVTPPGCEWERSHRVLVRLAERLAERGHPVLRLDLRGSGDSSLELEEVLPSDWHADIFDGISELLSLSGHSRAIVAGLRLGCRPLFDVASHPAVAALALWEPVLTGVQQLSDWLAVECALFAPYGAVPEVFSSGAPRACLGQRLGERLAAALTALPAPEPPRKPVTWIGGRQAPAWARHVPCPGPAFWANDPDGMLVPVATLETATTAIANAGNGP